MALVTAAARVPTFHAEHVDDPGQAETYRNLRQRLAAVYPNPKDANGAMAYLATFVRRYNEASGAAPADRWRTDTLDGTREGCDVAMRAWRAMQTEYAWTPRYLRRVRTTLSRALQELVPALAVVINPALRAHALVRIESTRSAAVRRQFTLVECLPLAVRRLSPRDQMF